MTSLHRVAGAIALALSLAAPGAALAQVKVISSGGAAPALRKIIPVFEKATGLAVELSIGKSQGAGPDTISAQLARGVRADVVVLSREGLDGLIAENRILAHSDTDLANTQVGLSVQAGQPKPDIATVEAFKRTLLAAKSVTFTDSTVGIYMVHTMFPRLGIATEMAAKSSTAGVAAVARGDAQMAIQPMSELLNVTGTDFVGAIPAQLQYVSVFSAGLVVSSANPDAAKFIAFLRSPPAQDVFRASGMTPMDSNKRLGAATP